MTWEIGNFALEFDPLSADDMERLEVAEKAKNDVLAQSDKETSWSKQIRLVCAATRAYFDALFGEGTSAKLFDGMTDSLRDYMPVVDSFNTYVEQIRADADTAAKKYTPKKAAVKKNEEPTV
jgi:hypothetical protein